MTILYTLYVQNETEVEHGAYLSRAKNKTELKRVMDEFNANACGVRITGWKPATGFAGDCWTKLLGKPRMRGGYGLVKNHYRDTDAGFSCHVRGPGEHPGGRAYWCDPVGTIYVPIFEYDAEAEE